MSDNPYAASELNATRDPPPPGASEQVWPSVVKPLYDVAGWMKFLGIVQIILGVIQCLTIIGAVVGWAPIWIGTLLLKSSDNYRTALVANNAVAAHEASSHLAKAIKIFGILMLVIFSLQVLYLFAVIVFAIVMGLSAAAP